MGVLPHLSDGNGVFQDVLDLGYCENGIHCESHMQA